MARIVPPFCFKFRMGEMISRKGENSSWKGPLEIVREEVESSEVKKKDCPESGSRHSEEQGDEESNNKRFFTEFTLSRKPRPFALLRVTHGEGFRMTTKCLIFQVALGRCHPECNEGSSSRTTPHSSPPILDSRIQSMLSFCFATTP
jgi:hypothetical protein